MTKLILEEDEIMEPEAIEAAPELSAAESASIITSLLSNLIQNRWEAIDLLNSNIILLQQCNAPEVNAVLTSMISDEYVHIGQLEKLLELTNAPVAEIESGKEDIEPLVDTVVEEE